MRRGARSSASASSDVVVISRLQIGHSLLRVVNHGVLPTNALATVTDVENDICGEGGGRTCMLRGIRGHRGE